jgi:hypothetical protein
MLFKRSNVMTFCGKNDFCKGSTSLSVQEFEASVGQPFKQGKSDNAEYYTNDMIAPQMSSQGTPGAGNNWIIDSLHRHETTLHKELNC